MILELGVGDEPAERHQCDTEGHPLVEKIGVSSPFCVHRAPNLLEFPRRGNKGEYGGYLDHPIAAFYTRKEILREIERGNVLRKEEEAGKG